jgi:drug/metabolite transporter (DMT)-like permease
MRYIILVLLNLPVILLALVNIITQHKLKHVTAQRFRHQIILWVAILVVLIGSFPFYNYLIGQPLLDSSELSVFDIIQTTAVIYLFYIVNDHRRKIERNERTVRDFHQELSIKLSTEKNGKS